MDGGWICGSNGLEKAKEMIENGYIQAAIVGVTNLVLRPEIQLQFQGLNRLTRNDHTKPFSFDGKYNYVYVSNLYFYIFKRLNKWQKAVYFISNYFYRQHKIKFYSN